MQCDALKQTITLARKHPLQLFKAAFFQTLCQRLDVETKIEGEKLVFFYNHRKEAAVIISSENCAQYKCSVQPGISGVRIWEFVKVLVTLFSDQQLPPSPHERAVLTAQYYVDEGTKILETLC